MRSTRLRSAVVISLVGFSPLIVAQESDTRLQTALASLFVNRPEGCLLISIQASQLTQSRETGKLLSISFYQDPLGANCASSPSFSAVASGQTDQFDLVVDPKAKDAVLTASVPVTFEQDRVTLPVAVNMKWSGIAGEVFPDLQRRVTADPPGRSGITIEHRNGYYRGATISGTIHSQGIDYAFGTARSQAAIHVSSEFSSVAKHR